MVSLHNRRQGCAASGAPNARIVQRTWIPRYLRGHRLRTRAMIGRVKSDRLLDFAHIPVGVLSQAYEHYLHSHAPLQQRKESRILHTSIDRRLDGTRCIPCFTPR